MGIFIVFLYPKFSGSLHTDMNSFASETNAQEAIQQESESKEEYYSSLQYYENWRQIAKILYEEQDSSSWALYQNMVGYIEQMKSHEITKDSSQQMYVDLSNSFRALSSNNAKRRIDSLLISSGYSPFYDIVNNNR